MAWPHLPTVRKGRASPSPEMETRQSALQDRQALSAEGIHSLGRRCIASASPGFPPAPPDARKAIPGVLAGNPAALPPEVPHNPRPSPEGGGMHKAFPQGHQKKKAWAGLRTVG